MCRCCCCWGCYLYTCVRLLRAFPFLLIAEIFLFVYFFQRRFFSFLLLRFLCNPKPSSESSKPPLFFLSRHIQIRASIVDKPSKRVRFYSSSSPSKEQQKKRLKGDLTHFRTTTNAHAHERIKKYVCAKSFDFDLVCFLFFGFNYQKVKRKKMIVLRSFIFTCSRCFREKESDRASFHVLP